MWNGEWENRHEQADMAIGGQTDTEKMVKNLCAFSASYQSIPKLQPPNPATPQYLLLNSQYSAACDSNSGIAIEEIKTLFEATQQIKATLEGQATIIITLTAHAFSEERLGMLEVGCDEFVPKPFRKDILWKNIAEYSIVQYVYDKQEQFTTPQLPQNRAVFTPRALAVKPRAWLAQIHRTAESCNQKEIFTIIEQIPEQQMALKLGTTSCRSQHSRSVLRRSRNENSSLLTPDFWLLTPISKTALKDLVDNFRFDLIFDLTQGSTDD